MKKMYTFLTLLIQGEKNAELDISVYLHPLIDLKLLRRIGMEIVDQSLKQDFIIRATNMWTITNLTLLSRHMKMQLDMLL